MFFSSIDFEILTIIIIIVVVFPMLWIWWWFRWCCQSINRFGALKMCRNVLTLQQNLSNLFACDEEPFERVRKYYELLIGSIEVSHSLTDSLSQNQQTDQVYFILWFLICLFVDRMFSNILTITSPITRNFFHLKNIKRS
jgi:hypothetical protein